MQFGGMFGEVSVVSVSGFQATKQEPLNAPFLNGLSSSGFSRGKTAHEGIPGNGPLRRENGPLRRGNAPLTPMGGFQNGTFCALLRVFALICASAPFFLPGWTAGVLSFLGVSKALSEQSGAKKVAKSGATCTIKAFFGGAESCVKFSAKLAKKLGLRFTATKQFTQMSLLLSPPKLHACFRTFSWFFPPAHPGLSCHGLFPFFMCRSKPHRESGPAVQQGYNITSNKTKKNVLERKMLDISKPL